MGRVLEALKKADWSRRASAASAATLAEPAVVNPLPSAEPEEVPFIEVGGPGAVLEASPAVLAGTGAAGKKGDAARSPAAKPHRLPLTGIPESASAEPGPVTVAFRPLPVKPPFGRAGDRFARELVAFHHPEGPRSEQYRVVWAGLAAQLPPAESHVLLFTTGLADAGQTTVLLNLAVTCARKGNDRIVVVDAKAGSTGIAKKLGLPAAPGLGDVLKESMPLQRALWETGQPNLHVLTAGVSSLAAGAEPTAESMRPILHQLRQHFDWVLVDGPAWGDSPEGPALGLACEAVYLVVRQAETTTPQFEELLAKISEHGCRLCGYIMTQP